MAGSPMHVGPTPTATNALRPMPRLTVPSVRQVPIRPDPIYGATATYSHATANADANDTLPAFGLFTTNEFDTPQSFQSAYDGPGGMGDGVPGTRSDMGRRLRKLVGGNLSDEELAAAVAELWGPPSPNMMEKWVSPEEDTLDLVDMNLARLGVRDAGPGTWPSPTLDPATAMNNARIENADRTDALPLIECFPDRRVI